jgi:hypothetical protein
VPAWEFSRFLALVEKGTPSEYQAPPAERRAEAEREDLEASMRRVKEVLGA